MKRIYIDFIVLKTQNNQLFYLIDNVFLHDYSKDFREMTTIFFENGKLNVALLKPFKADDKDYVFSANECIPLCDVHYSKVPIKYCPITGEKYKFNHIKTITIPSLSYNTCQIIPHQAFLLLAGTKCIK